jgi:hypothetical protein
LRDPGKYGKVRYGESRKSGKFKKLYRVLIGIVKPGESEEQAYRYSRRVWSASEARAHCRAHGGSFEAAKGATEEVLTSESSLCYDQHKDAEVPMKLDGIELTPAQRKLFTSLRELVRGSSLAEEVREAAARFMFRDLFRSEGGVWLLCEQATIDRVLERHVRTQSLGGLKLLEESESNPLPKGVIARGVAPMILVDQETDNHTIYSRAGVQRMLEEKQQILADPERSKMYTSHHTFLKGENPYTTLSGRVTDLTEETPGVVGTAFNVLDTGTGRDTHALILNGIIHSVSLRAELDKATAVEEVRDGHNVLIANGWRFEGADFTGNPAMPFSKDETLRLLNEYQGEETADGTEESEQEGDETEMTKEERAALLASVSLDELKATNPALCSTLEETARKEEKDAAERAKDQAVEDAKKGVLEEAKAKEARKREILADLTTLTAGLGLNPSALEEVRGKAIAAVDAAYASGNPTVEEGKKLMKDSVREHATRIAAFLGEEKVAQMQAAIDAGGKQPTAEMLLSEKGVNITALDPKDRDKGMLLEECGQLDRKGEVDLTTRVDRPSVLLARIHNHQMYKPGPMGERVHVLEEFGFRHEMAAIKPLLEDRATWCDRAPNPALMQQVFDYDDKQRWLLEGNAGMTSYANLSTLHPDIIKGIIMEMFPQLIALKLRDSRPIGAPTAIVYSATHRRTTDTQLDTETFASGNNVTHADVADPSYPIDCGDLVAEVTTEFAGTNGSLVFTLTGTDAIGETMKATVTWTVAAGIVAVGTEASIVPYTPGRRFATITACEVTSGTWTAGVWEINCPESFVSTRAAAAQETGAYKQSKVTLAQETITAQRRELGAELSFRMIEDSNRALAATGPGAWNPLTHMIEWTAKEIADWIDEVVIYRDSLAASSTGYTASYAKYPAAAGLTETEQKQKVLQQIARMCVCTQMTSKVSPNWLLMNPLNVTDDIGFELIKGETRLEPWAAEWFRSAAVGQIAGRPVYMSDNAYYNLILAGNNKIGAVYGIYLPLVLYGPQNTVKDRAATFLWCQEAADAIVQENTRGRLVLTDSQTY